MGTVWGSLPGVAFTFSLKSGHQVIIDDEDAEIVKKYSWHIQSSYLSDYAITDFMEGGKRKRLYLHRLLMNPEKGLVVDHLNGNGLDNRRANLRVCRSGENT